MACVGKVWGCSGGVARETAVVLDPDRDIGVTDSGGYVGWGGLVDLYDLVVGRVVGRASSHAEEVLVCHALGKLRVGGDWITRYVPIMVVMDIGCNTGKRMLHGPDHGFKTSCHQGSYGISAKSHASELFRSTHGAGRVNLCKYCVSCWGIESKYISIKGAPPW